MQQISQADWRKVEAADFPFSDHEYLCALEKSGSVHAETLWHPQHLTHWESGDLAGALIMYRKNHSYGEYIFDWAWAEAYAAHGVPYFPKLCSAIPFTPATGPKLLFSRLADKSRVASALLNQAKQKLESLDLSSLHFLFLPAEQIPYFEKEGFLIRHSFQYHWRNQQYRTFDDFLDRLKSRKRKAISKERSQLSGQGITIEVLTGAALTPQHADFFYACYLSTIRKMGAIAYLSPSFFATVFSTMSDRLLLMVAKSGDQPIASSLFYQKGTALFGRYWGAIVEVKHLHFELCYYRAIEYAIEHRLTLFEAGAQGEHKLARGFLPEVTWSAHWIRHPGFREAIARFIAEEKKAIGNFLGSVPSPYGVD